MFRHHNPQLTSGNSTRGKINQKPEDQSQDQELFSSSQSVQVDQTLTVNPDLVITFPSSWKENLLQSNPAISNSVNSKSPLFRRKTDFPWIYPSLLRFPGYFETPLFRTFFYFPCDFEIVAFDCSLSNFTLQNSCRIARLPHFRVKV